MILITPAINFVKQKLVGRSGHIARRDILVWGIGGLFVLLLGLLYFDTYIFQTRILKQHTAIVSPRKGISLSQTDVEEIVVLLNQRQAVYNNLLGINASSTPPTATTTPLIPPPIQK